MCLFIPDDPLIKKMPNGKTIIINPDECYCFTFIEITPEKAKLMNSNQIPEMFDTLGIPAGTIIEPGFSVLLSPDDGSGNARPFKSIKEGIKIANAMNGYLGIFYHAWDAETQALAKVKMGKWATIGLICHHLAGTPLPFRQLVKA